MHEGLLKLWLSGCSLPYAKEMPDGCGIEDDYAGGGSEDENGGGSRRASVRNRGKPNMKVGGDSC